MSIHMALQVFHANDSRLGPDGLYRYRYLVYVFWIVLPATMAALAFTARDHAAYLSQGAFCSLPVRPFWYRLALTWIPRYLIWAYVMITAYRIYRHVGTGFQVFARQVDDGSNSGAISGASATATSQIDRKDFLGVREAQLGGSPQASTDSTSPAVRNPESRRSSTIRFKIDGEDEINNNNTLSPNVRRNSRITDHDSLWPASPLDQKKDPLYVMMSSDDPTKNDALAPITETQSNLVANSTSGAPLQNATSLISQAHDNENTSSSKRRRAIQRQVRLLFIYPCVYMILMIMPFINHCFNYSDHYAQHPIYYVNALSSFCLAITGFADCLVFSWRERPWRNIPGSDGTLLGSLKFWRILYTNNDAHTTSYYDPSKWETPDDVQLNDYGVFTDPSEQNRPTTSGSNKRFAVGLKPIVQQKAKRPVHQHRRVFSGNSDRATQDAERAAERLALERLDAIERARHVGRKNTVGSMSEKTREDGASTVKGGGDSKEWWEREEDLSDDDESVIRRSVRDDANTGDDGESSTRKPSVADGDTGASGLLHTQAETRSLSTL